MRGASSEPSTGVCCSRLITGSASSPTSGSPVRNSSKSVTSVTRTWKVCEPLSTPVSRSQVRYGRIEKSCGPAEVSASAKVSLPMSFSRTSRSVLVYSYFRNELFCVLEHEVSP